MAAASSLPRGGMAALEEHSEVARTKLTAWLIYFKDFILVDLLPKANKLIQYILDRRIVFLSAGVVTGKN